MSCCCPSHANARDCFDLRHYGYAPRVLDDEGEYIQPYDRDECQCGCHAEQREADEDVDLLIRDGVNLGQRPGGVS